MFTGIITNTAKVKSQKTKDGSLYLEIAKPPKWKLSIGESISTDGVCLTVKKITPRAYAVELMPETLGKTTFGKKIPAIVNLERSLTLTDRMSGHFVSGHVDTVGKIIKIEKHGASLKFFITYPSEFKKFLISKGSIAIDGVSLTVVDVTPTYFSVALLAHTLSHTTLGKKNKDDLVNLEFDLLAKYAQKQKKS